MWLWILAPLWPAVVLEQNDVLKMLKMLCVGHLGHCHFGQWPNHRNILFFFGWCGLPPPRLLQPKSNLLKLDCKQWKLQCNNWKVNFYYWPNSDTFLCWKCHQRKGSSAHKSRYLSRRAVTNFPAQLCRSRKTHCPVLPLKPITSLSWNSGSFWQWWRMPLDGRISHIPLILIQKWIHLVNGLRYRVGIFRLEGDELVGSLQKHLGRNKEASVSQPHMNDHEILNWKKWVKGQNVIRVWL